MVFNTEARDAIPSPEVRRRLLAVETRERSSSLRHEEHVHDTHLPATPDELAKQDEDIGYIEVSCISAGVCVQST